MMTKITPEQQIEDSKTIIKTILNLQIHPDMQEKVIDIMIWNITGAYGKYQLPYISLSAKNNPDVKIIHEHVYKRKTMVKKILDAKIDLEIILDQAFGCNVTEEEHKKLNKIDKENPLIDGWQRYELADIKVFDIRANKELTY